jgi:hypothetical protein
MPRASLAEAGQLLPRAMHQEIKVFWFFSSEKNSLALTMSRPK